MAHDINTDDLITKAEILEFFSDTGAPYYLGSYINVPVGTRVVLASHPLVIIREVTEQEVLSHWGAMNNPKWEVTHDVKFTHYYEVTTD